MGKDVAKQDDMGFMLEDSEMMMVVMMIMMMVIMLPIMTQAASAQAQTQALEAQAYIGNEDPRNITVTNHLSWINLIYEYPFQPWISAFIINDGPSPVEIGINFPDDRFTINPGETRTVTRTGAEERINIMYFKTPFLHAALRITGVY